MAEEIKYNGPEMNVKKILVLLLTAALIVVLFLTRNSCQRQATDDGTEQELPEQYVYISPFDSIFRKYADSVCDW